MREKEPSVPPGQVAFCYCQMLACLTPQISFLEARNQGFAYCGFTQRMIQWCTWKQRRHVQLSSWRIWDIINIQHLGRSKMAVSYADAKIEVEGLVERVLELHKKLVAANIPAGKVLYQRQIEATDRQIDALV